jgi:DNA polymerase-3 subunit alpha
VELALIGPGLPGEVAVGLPGHWPVTPQIGAALKSLPGVVDVEEI